jgi:hypothetical protein
MLPPSTVKPVLLISPADARNRGARDKHTLLELLHEVVHDLLQSLLIDGEFLLEFLDGPQKVLGQLLHGPCITWLVQLNQYREDEPHPCGRVVV